MDQTDAAPEKSRVIGVLVIVAGAFGASLFRMPPDQSSPRDGTSPLGPREGGLAVRVAESTGQGNDVVLRDSSSLPPADIATLARSHPRREAAREPREFGSRPHTSAPPSMPAEYGRLGATRLDETARAELQTPAAVMTPKKRQAKRRSEHRVRDGDTLESIAKRHYDDERRADDIFEANRSLLPSRNLLPVNVTIKLPAFESLQPLSKRDSRREPPPTGPETRTTLGSVR